MPSDVRANSTERDRMTDRVRSVAPLFPLAARTRAGESPLTGFGFGLGFPVSSPEELESSPPSPNPP